MEITESHSTGKVAAMKPVHTGDLLRLREQLASREQVIIQLNRRLHALESSQPESELQIDENLLASYQQQLGQLASTLREERRSNAEMVSSLEAEVERLHSQVRELEGLRIVRMGALVRRVRKVARRLSGQ